MFIFCCSSIFFCRFMAAAFPVQEIVIIAVVVLVVTMILFWPEKQT